MLYEPPAALLATLRLRVADLVFGASTFYQEAEPLELKIRFLKPGREVQLLVQPVAYEMLADGSKGKPVPLSFLKPEPVLLVGNSNCAVAAADGQPRYRLITEGRHGNAGQARNLLTDTVEEVPAGQTWLDFLQAKPELLLLQHLYFAIICAQMEIGVDDLTLEYLGEADAKPSRFVPAA